MASTELQDIKVYWTKKYPNVDIMLWTNEDGNKYFGKMLTHNQSFDLNASTIGDVISQGEGFLRRVV